MSIFFRRPWSLLKANDTAVIVTAAAAVVATDARIARMVRFVLVIPARSVG
ncbi:MAG: hypothetical protein QHH24_07805 [Candidatus Bathyarchaeota archaeon]|nr:hypothetical protein [Candidatus Bathyarchaeota archaeon]